MTARLTKVRRSITNRLNLKPTVRETELVEALVRQTLTWSMERNIAALYYLRDDLSEYCNLEDGRTDAEFRVIDTMRSALFDIVCTLAGGGP